MNRLAFSGYYGMSNYGDDIFAVVSLLGAKRYWQGSSVRLLCPPVEQLNGQFEYPSFLPSELFARHSLLGTALRATTQVVGAFKASHLIFAGGSVFSSGALSVRDLVVLSRGRRADYSAIGVSVGPFSSVADEERVKEKLKMLSYISLRDRVSYERAMSYDLPGKVVEGADLAGTLPLLRSKETAKRSKVEGELLRGRPVRIGFSPCFILGREKDAEMFCNLFVEAVASLSKEIALQVDVFCLNQHYKVGDVMLSQYVDNVLRKRGVVSRLLLYKDFGVLNTWDKISQMDAYVGARMHGAVTAYLTGVPFLLFEYHEKCTEFLDYIGKNDSERLKSSDIDKSDFLEMFRRVLHGGEACSMPVDKFSALSERNFVMSPLHTS